MAKLEFKKEKPKLTAILKNKLSIHYLNTLLLLVIIGMLLHG